MKNSNSLFPSLSTPVTRGDFATMARLGGAAGSVGASTTYSPSTPFYQECRSKCGGRTSGSCFESCLSSSWLQYGCGPLGCP